MDNKIKNKDNKNNRENKDNKRDFLWCCVCGNIVETIVNAGPKISCCGKEMIAITANAETKRKDVPVIKINGNTLSVEVDSVPTLTTERQYISWKSDAPNTNYEKMACSPEFTEGCKK